MSTTARTPDEQAFWDRIFSDQFPACVKKLRHARGVLGCAQLAREEADAALGERRRSVQADEGRSK